MSDAIVLSVRLKSGGFESHIEVPVHATRAEIDKFMSAWLELMDAGIKMGRSLPLDGPKDETP